MTKAKGQAKSNKLKNQVELYKVECCTKQAGVEGWAKSTR